MQRAALTLILATAFFFGDLERALACSCVESAGVSVDFAQSGSVFEGKVTRLQHEPKQHRLTARVEVLRRWKGAPRSPVDVVTIDEGSLCGFGFERGKSYLLFTPETDGTLSVSLCSRSKASESAAADFTELDRLVAGERAPAPVFDAGTEAPLPAPSPTGAPAPSPTAPTPAPEPTTAATEPGHGGCAGCGAVPSITMPGYLAALALLLARGLRRSRAPR
jgi:hypothetical protein